MADEPERLDWLVAPARSTIVGSEYWRQVQSDTMLWGHIVTLHDDSRQLLRRVSEMPRQLRNLILADPVERSVLEEQIQSMALEELIAPGYKPLLERIDQWGPKTESFLRQLLVGRSVDNFLTYLSDMVALLFQTRPEALRSEEQVTVTQVLAHADMSSFISWFAERKVAGLSYKGWKEIAEFIDRRFGLQLVSTPELEKCLTEFIAVRNVIAHRRGRIDARFIELVGTEFGNVGETVKAMRVLQKGHIDEVAQVVRDFDAAAAAKFGLPLVENDQDILFGE